MASSMYLRVGDYAVTNKGLPGIKAGTDVQIAGIGIQDGKLKYSAALLDVKGKPRLLVGPYPAHAFTFVCECPTKELLTLFAYVTKQQKVGVKPKRESETDHDERCADDLVRDIGAPISKVTKRSVRKTLAMPRLVSAAEVHGNPVVKPKPKASKQKGPKPEPTSAPKSATEKYDNSHNWGHKGRVAQRTKDDLAATKNPPHEEWPESEQGTAPFGLRDNY